MRSNCIFCAIARGESPATITHKGSNLFAIHDKHPQAPVHQLIIPIKHIRSINDLQKEDLPLVHEMVECGKNLARTSGIEKSGYKLLFNVERGGGQVIFHLHLHLIGGWDDERLHH